MIITIKSFNGIGDLLFATPSFKVIKEAYPNCKLVVNTNRPSLLEGNPYIDQIGTKNEGVFLSYPAPDGGVHPYQHHILSDWEIICKEYNLLTRNPELRPEVYFVDHSPGQGIGVQVRHKRNYHSKRVWKRFEELALRDGFEEIPEIVSGDKMQGLVKKISKYKAVVCPEGGVSHIAAALKMPAVVLMGGFTDPKWTGYDGHINITSDIDCKHCFNNSPCKRSLKCWDEISVNYVEEIVKSLFAKNQS